MSKVSTLERFLCTINVHYALTVVYKSPFKFYGTKNKCKVQPLDLLHTYVQTYIKTRACVQTYVRMYICTKQLLSVCMQMNLHAYSLECTMSCFVHS